MVRVIRRARPTEPRHTVFKVGSSEKKVDPAEKMLPSHYYIIVHAPGAETGCGEIQVNYVADSPAASRLVRILRRRHLAAKKHSQKVRYWGAKWCTDGRKHTLAFVKEHEATMDIQFHSRDSAEFGEVLTRPALLNLDVVNFLDSLTPEEVACLDDEDVFLTHDEGPGPLKAATQRDVQLGISEDLLSDPLDIEIELVCAKTGFYRGERPVEWDDL